MDSGEEYGEEEHFDDDDDEVEGRTQIYLKISMHEVIRTRILNVWNTSILPK